MLEQLFFRSDALTRQLSAPLVGERRQYLLQCASQGMARRTLRAKARLLLGVPSENGPDRTLRLTQRPEFAFTEFRGVAPLVVAGEIDVLPAKRGKMLSERRVWGMPVFA
jgi:hypothetical protein